MATAHAYLSSFYEIIYVHLNYISEADWKQGRWHFLKISMKNGNITENLKEKWLKP